MTATGWEGSTIVPEPIAIVTGGTSGIGLATARKLTADGFRSVIFGRSSEEHARPQLDELALMGLQPLFVHGDVTNKTDRERLVRTVRDTFGRIDVLVNNAGVAPPKRLDILDTTEESFDFVMDVNLRGLFFLTQLTAKAMIQGVGEAKEGDHYRPSIVNISSLSAYTSSTNRAEYCISKAGVSMVTKLFADRLAQYGIGVYEVRPGIIATDMTKPVKEMYDSRIREGLAPIARWGQPEDVAAAVSVLCSGTLSFSTGEVINVDGGFHLRRM